MAATPLDEKLIWSLDDGYGDNKGVNGLGDGRPLDEKSNEWEKFLSTGQLLIPSYATEWIPMPNKDLNENVKIDPLSYIKVELNGEAWLLGQGAMEQNPEGWVGGENKHDDYRFPVMFWGCLALLGYQVQSEEISIDALGMGLPTKIEDKPERHVQLTKLAAGTGELNGWTEVKVTLADGTEIEKHINIKELVIKKQPFGSLCDVILDDIGELGDQTTAAQFNVVADIGARTFNVYTCEMLKMQVPLTYHTNDGMYEAYGQVNAAIEELTGGKVQDTFLPEIVKRGFIGRHDLSEKTKIIYSRHAQKITNELEKRFLNFIHRIDLIIWTGGGSTVLQPWLQAYRPDKKQMFLDRFATARGLRKAAKRQLLLAARAKVKKRGGSGEVAATKE